MTLEGNIPSDSTENSLTGTTVTSKWRTVIPDGNWWMLEGRNYLESLDKDQICFILERNQMARLHYLDAIDPNNAEYTILINIPMLADRPDEDSAKQINNSSGVKDSALYTVFRGVCPFPY